MSRHIHLRTRSLSTSITSEADDRVEVLVTRAKRFRRKGEPRKAYPSGSGR